MAKLRIEFSGQATKVIKSMPFSPSETLRRALSLYSYVHHELKDSKLQLAIVEGDRIKSIVKIREP